MSSLCSSMVGGYGWTRLTLGEDQLMCMTRSFDTIFEGPLRDEDFGEGESS